MMNGLVQRTGPVAFTVCITAVLHSELAHNYECTLHTLSMFPSRIYLQQSPSGA